MNKVALVRIVLLKRKPELENSYSNALKSFDLIGLDTFVTSFVTPISNKKELIGARTLDDEVEFVKDDIEALIKDKPNGFYEIMGEMWMESWCSYEGEWDSEVELRNCSINACEYHNAAILDDYDFLEHSESMLEMASWTNTCNVSPYMSYKDIISGYANALEIIRQGSAQYLESDFSVDDIKNYITMLEYEIEAENNKEKVARRIKATEKFEHILKEHKYYMLGEEDSNGARTL